MSIELTKLVADFDTQLATAASIGVTTATLVSATDDDGNALPTGLYALTIDAGNSSKEYILCTLTSTALTGILSITRQGVTSSGFARTHRRGAKVTITDWSALKSIQSVLETGYASATTPTTDYQLATKKYVDDASFIGTTNASTTTPGVVELPTQAEVDAKTASGGLGPLVVTPDTLRATKYNDGVASATGTDAYAITVVPAITVYATNQEFTFIADVANTGACTLNVSALGAKTIKKNVSSDLETGDIVAGQIVKVIYDGTAFQMVSRTSATQQYVNVSNSGVDTRNMTTASGTQVIAHGLGQIPTFVTFSFNNANDSTDFMFVGNGTYTTNGNRAVHGFLQGTSGTGSASSGSSTSYAIAGLGATNTVPTSSGQTGIVTVDATNITITWTKNGTPTGTIYFMWQANY